MSGLNVEICLSCREKDHVFAECPNKKRCPRCKIGFVKCFEVTKETDNKGKLFNRCSAICKYWEWIDDGASSSRSSSGLSDVAINVNSHAALEEVQQFSRMFHSLCQVTEERNIEISLNVTISRVNDGAGVDKKGKRPA